MNDDLTKQVIATIASGASLSNAIDLEGYTKIAIEMPLGWTTANITLQASKELAGQYKDVYADEGTEISITGTAGKFLTLGTAIKTGLGALRFIKLRSGTTGSAVNQVAAREIIVHLKK